MKIYEILTKDHDKLKQLMNKISKAPDPDLFSELKKEVILHSEAEEEVFYHPLEKKAGDLKIIVESGRTEHDTVMDMIDQIDKIEDEEEWISLFSVIKKSLEAHLLMEEKDIFDLSKKYFSNEQAQEMGENMKKRKKELEEQYEDSL